MENYDNYFDLIAKRESCRNFDPDRPVEQEKLIKCLDAARIAPSGCNAQPWKFIVVRNPELKKQLVDAMNDYNINKFAYKCDTLVVITEEFANVVSVIAARFGNQVYAPIDIGLSTMQFCLAATAQGLSTCIMAWMDPVKVKDALGLPQSKRVRVIIGLGYAANDNLRKKDRRTLEEIVEYRD